MKQLLLWKTVPRKWSRGRNWLMRRVVRLNSIYSAVERQAQMIESIARAANEQTSVSEAVAVAMGRISEITRQTDAGTQEAAVSVSYLAELSEQLRASVSTFRLPDRTQ